MIYDREQIKNFLNESIFKEVNMYFQVMSTRGGHIMTLHQALSPYCSLLHIKRFQLFSTHVVS